MDSEKDFNINELIEKGNAEVGLSSEDDLDSFENYDFSAMDEEEFSKLIESTFKETINQTYENADVVTEEAEKSNENAAYSRIFSVEIIPPPRYARPIPL